MKKLIITTMLLILWVGLFSQEFRNLPICQVSATATPDMNESVKDGSKTAVKSANPSDFQEYIIDWANTNHVPGMSVSILKNGDVCWKYHFGFANIAENKPVTDSTAFLLCSISKLITQTAAMQLYEQELFELEDDINDYLPFEVHNPTHPDSVITFYHLMTHTSSIKDYWAILNQNVVWGQDSPIPLGDFLEGYLVPGGAYYDANNWYNYSPCGGQVCWNYSNVGNALLGYLVQVISGQPFDAYCQEHIFDPLGIDNASFFLANMDTSLLATPYQWSDPSFIPHLQPGSPEYPAGMLKMSALDLSKFLGMYMNHGTYNGNTILNPETIELITTPLFTSLYGPQCLSWFYNETLDMTFWGGMWTNPPISSTTLGYDKDDQWGIIFLLNTNVNLNLHSELESNLANFAQQYDAFSVETISLTDADGDLLIESNEEFSLGLKLRNNMNVTDFAENVTATITFNSPYISLIGDSVINLGTINYLDEIQLPDDQFVFEVGSILPRGNIEFQLLFTWDYGKEYTTTFKLFGGLADVLLICDEEESFTTHEWYFKVLDSLDFVYHYFDLNMMDDPSSEFINNFPAVICFTGNDSINTISASNQDILAGYLDNGGQLFISGQNISDELTGSDFLENYLHTEHIEDTWTGNNIIEGIAFDPIGNGLYVPINTPNLAGATGVSQFSMSVIDPLDGAQKVFGYNPTFDGAAVRYENDTYKTVFFAFGFEAICFLSDRYEIMSRIMNDYFVMPHPCLPEGITFTTQEEVDNFQYDYPGCVEIEGDVNISGPDISNLNGLSVLTSILENLTIENNGILTDFDGLINLTSIGGALIIDGNNSLNSLVGLGNITPASITDLTIINNSSLSDCAVWSVCQYLQTPGGNVEIHDNATGCNNLGQVQAACDEVSVLEIETEQDFIISPNPLESSALIKYTLHQNSSVTLNILDLSGRIMATLVDQFQHQGEQRVVFNTTGLPTGVYFCVLKTNPEASGFGRKTTKMIKL